jgi:hypothetical protein
LLKLYDGPQRHLLEVHDLRRNKWVQLMTEGWGSDDMLKYISVAALLLSLSGAAFADEFVFMDMKVLPSAPVIQTPYAVLSSDGVLSLTKPVSEAIDDAAKQFKSEGFCEYYAEHKGEGGEWHSIELMSNAPGKEWDISLTADGKVIWKDLQPSGEEKEFFEGLARRLSCVTVE